MVTVNPRAPRSLVPAVSLSAHKHNKSQIQAKVLTLLLCIFDAHPKRCSLRLTARSQGLSIAWRSTFRAFCLRRRPLPRCLCHRQLISRLDAPFVYCCATPGRSWRVLGLRRRASAGRRGLRLILPSACPFGRQRLPAAHRVSTVAEHSAKSRSRQPRQSLATATWLPSLGAAANTGRPNSGPTATIGASDGATVDEAVLGGKREDTLWLRRER
mmetsp:Transcript_39213/g.103351  ORF Transcript_39213/g.103351 Transcript_39213/m.103351 type:complete len:214 (+) Transcript_39213:128-769(+)